MSHDIYNQDLEFLRRVFADVQNAPFIPSPLMTDATCSFWLKQIPTITKILSPIQDDDTIRNFIYDYSGFLLGYRSYTATDEQQRRILDVLPPTKAFVIDPWALYLMIRDYSENEKLRPYVNAIVADPSESNTMSLIKYVNDNPYFGVCCSVAWYMGNGQLTYDSLVGLNDSEYANFENVVTINQRTIHYATYYILARACYGATQEELDDAIPDEDIPMTTTSLRECCKQLYDDTERTINEMQQTIVVAMSEDDPKKTAVAKKDFSDLSENKVVSIFKYPSRLGVLLSSFVELSTDLKGSKTFAIQEQIEYYNRNTPGANVSETLVERVVAGFGELYNEYDVPEVNDTLVFNTSLFHFAKLVVGCDPNANEKLQVLHALLLLNKKYVVLRNERKKPTIVNLVNIEQFGDGDIKLTMSKKLLTAHILRLNNDGYTDIKKLTKGQAETRFRHRVLSSNNVKEDVLLSEMYDYEHRSKEYVQKHKSDHRKRVIKLFELFQKDGYLLKWERIANDYKQFVYYWEKSPKILTTEFSKKDSQNKD